MFQHGLGVVLITGLGAALWRCSRARAKPSDQLKFDGQELLGDFTHLSWSEAFSALVCSLERHYAYTAHRGIQWKTLLTRYLPLVQEAQLRADRAAYYLAVHDLMAELRDGHCHTHGTTPAMEDAVDAMKDHATAGGNTVVAAALLTLRCSCAVLFLCCAVLLDVLLLYCYFIVSAVLSLCSSCVVLFLCCAVTVLLLRCAATALCCFYFCHSLKD